MAAMTSMEADTAAGAHQGLSEHAKGEHRAVSKAVEEAMRLHQTNLDGHELSGDQKTRMMGLLKRAHRGLQAIAPEVGNHPYSTK